MKRKTKENKLKIVWKQTGGLSKEEARQNLNGGFDLLFGEVIKIGKKI